jgi:surface carbohydrate biosynthesis protein
MKGSTMSRHNRKKTILCVYAFKRRDIFSVVLLKYILERYFNYRFILIKSDFSYTVLASQIQFYKPDLVMLLNIQLKSQKAVVVDAQRYGYNVILWASEMFNGYTGQQFLLNNKKILDRIGLYLSPGRMIRDFLIKHMLMDFDRVKVVGYSRYDQYAKPFSELFSESQESFLRKYNLVKDKPILLWASNNRYPRAFDPSTKKSYIHDAETNLRLDGERRVQVLCRAHLASVKAVHALARRFKDQVYVLFRPRQGELIEPYQKLFQDLKNVHLVHNENLQNLFLYSDLIFHSYSMLGTEAWFYQKPTASYCFAGAEEYYGDRNVGCEDFIRSEDELLNYVYHFLQRGLRDYFDKYRDNQLHYINSVYDKIDGLSTLRIASCVNNFCQRHNSKTHYETFRFSSFKLWLKHILGLEDFQSFNWMKNRGLNSGFNTAKFIYKKEIDDYFAKFDSLKRKIDEHFKNYLKGQLHE